MALRNDPEDVLDVMPGTDLTGATVLPFLTDASTWVDNYLAGGKCPGLVADKLPIIEKYLAAHLATLADGVGAGEVIQAQRADIAERYAELGKGQSTRYIATAAAFDRCGIVAEHWMDGRRMRAHVGKGYAG